MAGWPSRWSRRFTAKGSSACGCRNRCGGAELDPLQSLQVIENVAYGDPSAGWVLMAAALAIGTGAAYLDDAAVEELFGGERLPVIVGQGTRPGSAVPRGRRLPPQRLLELRLRHQARHAHPHPGVIEGTGEPRIFVLPVEQATLIDNWDVMGLRATGSIDYTIDSVFVPEGYTHIATTETPKRGGNLYTIGILGFAAMCHSAWALGIGRRMLDELAAGVQVQGGRAGTQATSESFLEQYAKAEGAYRAARALVFETWDECGSTARAGRAAAVRQQTLIRLAIAHVTWASHEVGHVRLHVGRHHRAAGRGDSAPVPRHARRHSASRRIATGIPRDRPRAGRTGAALVLEVCRSRRSPC